MWDARAPDAFLRPRPAGHQAVLLLLGWPLFAFASEIKALLEHPRDFAGARRVGAGRVSGFRLHQRRADAVRRNPQADAGPSPLLALDGGRSEPKIERYWDVPAPGPAPSRAEDEDWIARMPQRLEETVRMRLMSDVPLGVFLSGGVDSSAIAALMKRMVVRPGEDVFGGLPAKSEYSELDYARQVARLIGSEHHEVVVGSDEFFNALPAPDLARGRTDHLAVERLAVFRLAAGGRAREGGADRRGQRRVVRAATRATASTSLNRRWARPTGCCRRRCDSGYGEWDRRLALLCAGALRRKLQHTLSGPGDSLESFYLDNFYSRVSAGTAARSCCRGAPATDAAYANYLPLLERRAGRIPARAAAVRGPENIPGGTAHEAGPDEHGLLRLRAACRCSIIRSWNSRRACRSA